MRLTALLIATATCVTTFAAGPVQEQTAIHLGPKAYRDTEAGWTGRARCPRQR